MGKLGSGRLRSEDKVGLWELNEAETYVLLRCVDDAFDLDCIPRSSWEVWHLLRIHGSVDRWCQAIWDLR